MSNIATFGAIHRGLVVQELEAADLTPAERAAFGLSPVRPVEGLEQNNAGISHTGWVPRNPQPAARDLPIYPDALQAQVPGFPTLYGRPVGRVVG
jgi:hypothetical protein